MGLLLAVGSTLDGDTVPIVNEASAAVISGEVAFAGTGLIAWLLPGVGSQIGELAFLSKYGIRVVMVSTGLAVSWADLREAGLRAFLTGLALWIGLAAATLVSLLGVHALHSP